MSVTLLAQLEGQLQGIGEKREDLKRRERELSKQASEVRKEIIKLDGAEEMTKELITSVQSAMEKGL